MAIPPPEHNPEDFAPGVSKIIGILGGMVAAIWGFLRMHSAWPQRDIQDRAFVARLKRCEKLLVDYDGRLYELEMAVQRNQKVIEDNHLQLDRRLDTIDDSIAALSRRFRELRDEGG